MTLNEKSCSKKIPSMQEKSEDLEMSQDVYEKDHRGHWGNHMEFILSIIGFSIGFGNIWRFPYVCYDNGGGAFLIPYIIMLILIGKPLYFMELALGQFTRQGPPGAFKIVPIAMGVGYAMLFTCLIICIYYNVLMVYTLYYTFASFQRHLPWSHCNNSFNTENCVVLTRYQDSANQSFTMAHNSTQGYNSSWTNYNATDLTSLTNLTNLSNFSNLTHMIGANSTSMNNLSTTVVRKVSSLEEFWKIKVLGFDRSTGIHDIGPIKWDLALILFLSWGLVFAMLFKGIQTSGKVIYVTATLPYLLLVILLIRGATLPGARAGILYLFTPQWRKLLDIKVWRSACAQIFYSLSLALGGITTFSSFNPFHNNCYKDAMIVSIMDTVTSLMAATVIFSYLGNMAQDMNISLAQGAETLSGPGLVFIVYPRAVSTLPIPQLWSVLFFIMLYSLGLDSSIALISTLTSAIHDQLPNLFPWKHKTYLCLALCFICFLLGLPLVTYGGFYVFDLVNFYVGDFCLIMIAAAELIAIMWIYGIKRFIKDIEVMLGRKIPQIWYWYTTWFFIGPIILLAIAIASLYDLVTQGEHKLDNYSFPGWAHNFGWTMTSLILAQIIIVGSVYFYRQPGTFTEKLRNSSVPSKDFWLNDCDYKDENFDIMLKTKLGSI
ncbi:sodium- and chloride-dependent glycine transporter 2-like isoform X1 [Gordionus sp. m RMFG-2023]|uniref:sodium- and chloride-dependent glycine transporter 2-like isoform X1 n=1 Tax=Gordionus sp. m RMFG-2023 TaxID=3053472 RepID=UPI0031FC79E0